MAPPVDSVLEEDELDDEDVEDREDDDGLLSELELADVVELAVVLSSSLPRSRNRATPIAASTTTPATINAISVFLLPFGCCPPGPPGGAHCCPGCPYCGCPYGGCPGCWPYGGCPYGGCPGCWPYGGCPYGGCPGCWP